MFNYLKYIQRITDNAPRFSVRCLFLGRRSRGETGKRSRFGSGVLAGNCGFESRRDQWHYTIGPIVMEDPAPESKPGPEPERLKIEGDWEEAVKKAMKKPRPDGGWPDLDPKA